jgi:type IV secretion system protein TrbL
MDTLDSLTVVLHTFSGKFFDSIQILIPYAKNLVLTLAVIDTVLSHLKQLEEGNHIHILIWNIMKYGFAYFAISNYSDILMTIVTGFVIVGLKAGNSGDHVLTVGQFFDPSSIIQMGTDLGMPFSGALRDLNSLTGSFGQQMSVASTQMGVELSFIIIAIQIFVIALEFYVIGALAIIFLPFGANTHTRFLADKVWPAIVACCVKLMVLAFILAVATPELYNRKKALADALLANPGTNITSAQSMESLGVSLALAFLCWQAPSMAAALMMGSSNSSASAAAGARGEMSIAANAAKDSGTSIGGRIGAAMSSMQNSGLGKATSSLGNNQKP